MESQVLQVTELKSPVTHEILGGSQSNEDVVSVKDSNDKVKTQAYSGLKDWQKKRAKASRLQQSVSTTQN